MKLGRRLFVCLFVSLLAVATDYPSKRGQVEVVRFPEFGDVKIVGMVRAHELPQVTFSDATGKELLRLSVGEERADTIEGGDPYPIIRLQVLQVSGLPTPMVFAGVMYAGGTDCSYWGRLAGYTNGKLKALSPSLPMVNTEGGYSLGKLEKGGPVELAAWNMIWADGEAHPDPHSHWIRLYRFNRTSGAFEYFRKYVVPKPKEVDFPNVLRKIPDFGC